MTRASGRLHPSGARARRRLVSCPRWLPGAGAVSGAVDGAAAGAGLARVRGTRPCPAPRRGAVTGPLPGWSPPPPPGPGGALPNLGARPGPLLPSRLGPRPGGGRRWRDRSASRRDLPAPGHRPPPPAGLRELCRGHFASQCRVAERLPSEFLCFWPCFPRFQQLQALPWTGICLLRVFDI